MNIEHPNACRLLGHVEKVKKSSLEKKTVDWLSGNKLLANSQLTWLVTSQLYLLNNPSLNHLTWLKWEGNLCKMNFRARAANIMGRIIENDLLESLSTVSFFQGALLHNYQPHNDFKNMILYSWIRPATLVKNCLDSISNKVHCTQHNL